MVKMKFTDNQKAFEYVLYMIAASYFDKAVCRTKLTERNMLLQYKEQKLDNQYKMEETCIKYMEGLVKRLPKKFFSQTMNVRLRRHSDADLTEILFENDACSVSFYGVYEGKRSRIYYKTLVK